MRIYSGVHVPETSSLNQKPVGIVRALHEQERVVLLLVERDGLKVPKALCLACQCHQQTIHRVGHSTVSRSSIYEFLNVLLSAYLRRGLSGVRPSACHT